MVKRHTKQQKGFGILEMMLASVLLVAVIAVLMKSMFASSQYTNDTAYARNYAVIVNQIAEKFYNQAEGCQFDDNSQNSSQDGGVNDSSAQLYENSTVTNDTSCDFDIISDTDASTYLDMSSSVVTDMQSKGIDPTQIKVTTCYVKVGQSC